ncbi:hypothetical protein V5O48_017546, partial [Marasmius crinis-equi]
QASPVLKKRVSSSDTANIGYATLNEGTTGGIGGTSTTVTTLDELTKAVQGPDSKIVIVDGTISGDAVVKVGDNTSILGTAGSSLDGVGLRVLDTSNVIIRNVKISKVLASTGDAIGIQNAHRIWIDHVDLSSDRDHDKDFYDGLLDITHGSTEVTVSNSKLYDHFKASLVGHSDSNGDEDKAITVTYANNYFSNLNSRTPSFRFGTGHLFNNFFENNSDGINARQGAQLLVENNVWIGAKKALYSTDGGFAVERGNSFGGGENSAPAGTLDEVPYEYTLLDASEVQTSVQSNAGQTLSF